MALFVRQNEERTQLQERLAAELQEKAKRRTLDEQGNDIEDSAYLKDTKSTTSLAGIWLLIIIIGIVLLVGFVLISAN